MYHVLLVKVHTKTKVRALLHSLALPGNSTLYSTKCHAGAGGVHLPKVDGNTIDFNKHFVSRSPVINLVEGKLNGDSICLHLVRTRASRDIDCLGNLFATSSQAAKEL